MRQLEQPIAQAIGVVALLVSHEPERHQRMEHARERAFGQAGRDLQVLEARGLGLLADYIEQVKALRERRRAAGQIALIGFQDFRLARHAMAASSSMRSKVQTGSKPVSWRIRAFEVS